VNYKVGDRVRIGLARGGVRIGTVTAVMDIGNFYFVNWDRGKIPGAGWYLEAALSLITEPMDILKELIK